MTIMDAQIRLKNQAKLNSTMTCREY